MPRRGRRVCSSICCVALAVATIILVYEMSTPRLDEFTRPRQPVRHKATVGIDDVPRPVLHEFERKADLEVVAPRLFKKRFGKENDWAYWETLIDMPDGRILLLGFDFWGDPKVRPPDLGAREFLTPSEASVWMAEAWLVVLANAASAFRAAHGRWPSKISDLVAPEREVGRSLEYPLIELPLDPWTEASFIMTVGPYGDLRFSSLGRDEKEGGSGPDQDLSEAAIPYR